MQAGDELAEREGLRDVVVAAGAEARDPVGRRIERREEEHGRLDAAGAQRLAEVAPVGVREPDVDHEDIRRLPALVPEGRLRAVAPRDVEALLGEPPDDQVAEPFVVLDDVHQCGHLRAVSRRWSAGDLTRA